MNRYTTTMLIFSLALGSQLANAGPAPDAPSVTVQFADLDLTHSAGAAALYQRLKQAAETVCASSDSRSRDLGSQTRHKECMQSAIGAAVVKVDQPSLTAYYRAQVTRNATTQIARN
jgi:UrcA family protein